MKKKSMFKIWLLAKEHQSESSLSPGKTLRHGSIHRKCHRYRVLHLDGIIFCEKSSYIIHIETLINLGSSFTFEAERTPWKLEKLRSPWSWVLELWHRSPLWRWALENWYLYSVMFSSNLLRVYSFYIRW